MYCSRLLVLLFSGSLFCTAVRCQTDYQIQIDPHSVLKISSTASLVSDGRWIYTNDESGHVVLMTDAQSPFDWSPLIRVDKGEIRSMTASPNIVYILDNVGNLFEVGSGTLSRALISRESISSIIGPVDIKQVVFSAGSLFLVGDDILYRFNPEVSKLIGQFQVPSHLPLSWAGQGNDIFALEPTSGTIYELNFDRSHPSVGTTWFIDNSKGRGKSIMPDDVVPGSDPSNFAGANFKPSLITEYEREIYAIDQSSRGLFVFSVHNRRPCRIEYRNIRIDNPSSILATQDSIYVLQNSSNRLLRLPRLIPGEVKFNSAEPVGAALTILEYLKNQQILPTRSIFVGTNIDSALTKAGIGLSVSQPSFNSFLCSLNYSSCNDGDVRSVSNRDLLIPDLYSEHIIDISDVVLTGKSSLREVQSDAIIKPEFASWKDPARIALLNNLPSKSDISEKRSGWFKIYVEKIRIVAAFYPDDLLNPQSPLQSLKREFSDKLSIVSLTETSSALDSACPDTFCDAARSEFSVHPELPATKAGSHQLSDNSNPPDLSDSDKQALVKEFKDLIKIIHYSRPGLPESYSQATPRVGVVEDNVDILDPDFAPESFESLNQLVPIQNSASIPLVSSLHKLRDFDELLDHGTSVAALIGAKSVDIEGTGLAAPQVVMIPISSKDPPIGEEIRQAELLGTTIFNLSLSFKVGELPQGLEAAIDQYRDSLFVVASGHHTDEACKPTLTYYPACWGEKPNVLTVAATAADGTSLMSKVVVGDREIHGSDWSQRYVWIAAPGEGYHSSGKGGSYVPVRGTSFATPLVTATAALLFAEGIKSGPSIKNRIVYTADYVTNLKDKVAAGGFLNIERALKFPRRTILVNEDKSELIVDLVLGTDLIVPTATDNITIALRNIKRITRDGGRYRIIYTEHNASANSELIRFVENVPEPAGARWKFTYYELNPSTFTRGKKVQADIGDFRDFIGPAE